MEFRYQNRRIAMGKVDPMSTLNNPAIAPTQPLTVSKSKLKKVIPKQKRVGKASARKR